MLKNTPLFYFKTNKNKTTLKYIHFYTNRKKVVKESKNFTCYKFDYLHKKFIMKAKKCTYFLETI